MSSIKSGDFVVTSKGNRGVVISVGGTIAKVKIGYLVHEIELYNLINVTDGQYLQIKYIDLDTQIKDETLMFLKHKTPLYDSTGLSSDLIPRLTEAIHKKLNKRVAIEQVLIP